MGESTRMIDVEKLISYSEDLVAVLKDRKDITNATQCLQHFTDLRSHCDSDSKEVYRLLQEYEEKIEACKKKTEQAKSEVVDCAEMDYLQKEFQEEFEKERQLKEEFRSICNEIMELERQRGSIEEQKKKLRNCDQDKLKDQRKLSMYASVTNIIPDLDDQSKISGLDRDKKVVKKFEFDPSKMTAFDACDSLWKMINSQ
ncbi:kinetochore protein SPC24 homolog isoform X2 [Hibiscus syriacus]|uniref:kinetochore protein SPC24 homolog isoform X2 n=1 Tax=Hibiscus syriacus TaxID=106335 RepID=UPI001920DA09|nr:kinetochore protein SPC24 homolog isoform X2 [Hibiscus syriacus]